MAGFREMDADYSAQWELQGEAALIGNRCMQETYWKENVLFK